MLMGFLGVGKLIRYIPYPVVSGYLSGVGLIIVGSQIPVCRCAGGLGWFECWSPPSSGTGAPWPSAGQPYWPAAGGEVTKAIPATIVGILAGLLTYLGLAGSDASMLQLAGNRLVVGPLGASARLPRTVDQPLVPDWRSETFQVAALLGSALTLAALLSIDTLKTCVVLDQMTRTRHEPNRELAAQGSPTGGLDDRRDAWRRHDGRQPGESVSGAKTRISGILEGVFALIAALMLGAFVAWMPVATLSGVLIVFGFRMIDTDPLRYLESRSTVLDFLVVLAVVAVALSVGLIAASATGVGLAIMLFLREQVGGNVIRRKSLVSQRSSTWYRPEAEMRLLEQKGASGIIFELQGSLLFRDHHRFYLTLEPELRTRDFIILDLQRSVR